MHAKVTYLCFLLHIQWQRLMVKCTYDVTQWFVLQSNDVMMVQTHTLVLVLDWFFGGLLGDNLEALTWG